ncbi:MAG: M28 family peptidase [Acidobacteria bacterium]|nr:M28 family peptidase [Acidobacteriota bacterium]
MALACSTISVPGPDVPAPPEEPRQESTLPDLLADLASIVGRETVDRGDELLRMFRERGFDPDVHEFSTMPSERQPREVGRNLIATLGAGRRDIVVGAHYDVVRLQDGSVVGGAVDNGAASVVLTRVAETLQRQELRHRVRVVLFDLEESGLLGSRAWVQDEDRDRTAAMVNVDVVVGDGTLMYGPTSHDGNEAVYRGLRVACAASGTQCMDFPRYPPSDDRAFQAAGIPNVSINRSASDVAPPERGRRVRTPRGLHARGFPDHSHEQGHDRTCERGRDEAAPRHRRGPGARTGQDSLGACAAHAAQARVELAAYWVRRPSGRLPPKAARRLQRPSGRRRQ